MYSSPVTLQRRIYTIVWMHLLLELQRHLNIENNRYHCSIWSSGWLSYRGIQHRISGLWLLIIFGIKHSQCVHPAARSRGSVHNDAEHLFCGYQYNRNYSEYLTWWKNIEHPSKRSSHNHTSARVDRGMVQRLRSMCSMKHYHSH